MANELSTQQKKEILEAEISNLKMLKSLHNDFLLDMKSLSKELDDFSLKVSSLKERIKQEEQNRLIWLDNFRKSLKIDNGNKE